MVQKLIIEVEKKVDLAQDVVDESLQEASVLAIPTEKLEKSSTQAAAAVQIKIKAAVSANKIAEKANDNSEKATADLIVADEVATTAKKVAKTIRKNSPKPVAPPVTVRPARSDALINISGLKTGQKIRVSVQVNIK
jgi:sRNA-binding protein